VHEAVAVGIGTGCLLFAAAVSAAGPLARKRMEASMLVEGTLGITPGGTVLAYSLDQAEELPPAVVQMIAKAVPRWTFKPVLVDGKPVAAKAKVHLRVVASDGSYRVAIRSACFGDQSSEIKRTGRGRPPMYPVDALRARMEATVYPLLRLDRPGHVADAIAQQVNLNVTGSERVLSRWREVFAGPSLRAAKTRAYSAAGPADPDFRVRRTPIVFQLKEVDGPERHAYGQWEGYVPGPVTGAPWSDADAMLSGAADALSQDGIHGERGCPRPARWAPADQFSRG
jgi:hypothetical protein